MPHADRSTRNVKGQRVCPYCGWPMTPTEHVPTCYACADLPALEPLDDRYLLTETPPHA